MTGPQLRSPPWVFEQSRPETDVIHAFAADLHVGNHKRCGGSFVNGLNERCRMAIEVFEAAAQIHPHVPLSILGDVFDTDQPSPQMISRVMSACEDRRVMMLAGNHDQTSYALGHNAVNVLHHARGVVAIEEPMVLNDIAYAPYAENIQEQILTVMDRRAQRGGHKKILAFHAGVRDEETPWFLKEARDAVDVDWLVKECKRRGFTHAFAGNWHNRRVWEIDGVLVVQCGSLCPTGWDDTSPDHGVTLLHNNGDVSFVPVFGPRFHRVRTQEEMELLRESAERKDGCQLFVEVVGTTENVQAIVTAHHLADGEKDNGLRIVMMPDDGDAEVAAARAAGKQAAEVGTLAEVLAAWCGALKVPGVDSEEIHQRCRKYLGL